MSPEDLDSLLEVQVGTSLSTSRKTSREPANEQHGNSARGSLPVVDSAVNDLKVLPASLRLPQKSLGQGEGTDESRNTSNSPMLARRSSQTFTGALRGERTTVEDIETTATDFFPLPTTLVLSGNHKGTSQSESVVSGNESGDTRSYQGSPIDNVGVSSSSHSHQRTTPPGPGPLHMAAKYAHAISILQSVMCSIMIIIMIIVKVWKSSPTSVTDQTRT